MSSAISVSVVIPLFNKKDYVGRAIQSVLNQSFQNYEVIVVDDGSTDGGADIVRQFNDARIKLVLQQNGGVSSARNRGIDEARADLVAFLDADDAYKSDFLERVMRLKASFPQAGAYATNYEILTINNRFKHGSSFSLSQPVLLNVSNYFKLAIHGSPVWSSAVAIHKAVFDKVGMFPVGIKLGEDVDTWIRIIFSYPIAYDPCVGATYYENANNRACVQLPAEKNPYIFQTLDGLCQNRPLSAGDSEMIREFKNTYIVLYAIQQISKYSTEKGRMALLECDTRALFWTKCYWLAISSIPRSIYHFLRKARRFCSWRTFKQKLVEKV